MWVECFHASKVNIKFKFWLWELFFCLWATEGKKELGCGGGQCRLHVFRHGNMWGRFPQVRTSPIIVSGKGSYKCQMVTSVRPSVVLKTYLFCRMVQLFELCLLTLVALDILIWAWLSCYLGCEHFPHFGTLVYHDGDAVSKSWNQGDSPCAGLGVDTALVLM